MAGINYFRLALRMTSALGILVGGTSAFAQQAAAETFAPTAEAGVQDIVVTAQRRSENLQRSSLSIQVLSAEAVQKAGATQASDLNTLVPGIQISGVGATVQVAIRGVGDKTTNPLGNPAVAFNVDGIYIGRPSSISNNFFDVARVEVLKGPQGTLYGRNASGGAVNLITNAPRLGASEGYFELEGGNYANKRIAGAFNLPLGATFALRAAFQAIDRDGYLSDGSSDQKGEALRLRGLWQPSSAVSLLLNFDIANQHGMGEGTVLLPRAAGGNPWQSINSPASSVRIVDGTFPPLRFGLVNQGQPRQDNDFINASAELNIDFGPAKLTIIPAYRHANENYEVWNGFQYGQRNSSDQTSVEARLSNGSDKLKWVIGGYYFDERQDVSAVAATSIVIQSIRLNYKPKTEAYAAFGEATYCLTDTLRIIGGIRYTSERKGLSGQTIDDGLQFGPNRVAEILSGDRRFHATTWKAGAEFDLASDHLLFATVATGFKSGGLNPTAQPNGFEPEKLTAYTVGSRNRFLGNSLQVNLEGFYWKYTNKQESAIGLTPGGNISFLTNNAADATLKGASIDVTARPTQDDTVHLFAEYNDASYGSFIFSVPSIPGIFPFNPATTACANTPAAGGAPFQVINCSGRQLVKAPKWTGSFGYDRRFAFQDGAELTASVNGQFSSGYWLASDFLPAERADCYATVNASLTLVSASKAWSITAYVKNITDHAVYTGADELPLQGPLIAATIGAPRTYGARVRFSF